MTRAAIWMIPATFGMPSRTLSAVTAGAFPVGYSLSFLTFRIRLNGFTVCPIGGSSWARCATLERLGGRHEQQRRAGRAPDQGQGTQASDAATLSCELRAGAEG